MAFNASLSDSCFRDKSLTSYLGVRNILGTQNPTPKSIKNERARTYAYVRVLLSRWHRVVVVALDCMLLLTVFLHWMGLLVVAYDDPMIVCHVDVAIEWISSMISMSKGRKRWGVLCGVSAVAMLPFTIACRSIDKQVEISYNAALGVCLTHCLIPERFF